jgi:hypothetical protein
LVLGQAMGGLVGILVFETLKQPELFLFFVSILSFQMQNLSEFLLVDGGLDLVLNDSLPMHA